MELENLEDFMIDAYDRKKLYAKIYMFFKWFFGRWHYRLFVRGKCALFGCKEASSGYGGGGYLPDDCYEWWCERCGAEGINHVVQTHELFYNDRRFWNFIEALQGK